MQSLGLVDQEVPVGQIQDAFPAPGFPQPPGNLESHEGLARAGRQVDQNALLSRQHCIHGCIDGSLLVIARRFPASLLEVSCQCILGIFFLFQSQDAAPALPEFIRGRELLDVAFLPGDEIVFNDAFAVAGIGKLQIHHLCISDGLLQSFGRMFVFRLGFHHCDGDISADKQHVVRAQAGLARMLIPHRHDPSRCEHQLFHDGIVFPSGSMQLGNDIRPAGISFSHYPSSTW